MIVNIKTTGQQKMTLKRLPIGIQAFSSIREDDFVYIDKTQMLHQMVSVQGRYFLSRPRRFGKSMLVSTLHALFEGRKQLFEGLYIYDKWDWNKPTPSFALTLRQEQLRVERS
jgi:hypothetical protein